MTLRQSWPRFLKLTLAILAGVSLPTSGLLQAQDPDQSRRFADELPREQRFADDEEQPPSPLPRRRHQPEDRRQREAGPLDRPGARILPPGPDWGGGRWVLGVTTQTTSTGVRIRSVMPGSAASRAGLERDDVIVTVDGFQVGRVGGWNYPLGEELQFRAGRGGDVLLLVQNRRNDQLVNLPVQLTRRAPFDDWPRRRERGNGRPFAPFGQDEPADRPPLDEGAIE